VNERFNHDDLIVWDDGDGPVAAIWHGPSVSWTVTGSEDLYDSVGDIVAKFPAASSWRRVQP
jgi:hypothetical protein